MGDMRYSNVTGAHPGWMAALEADDYDGPGVDEDRVISVTRLIAPVQQVTLARRHADMLITDVAEAGFMIMGTAIHAMLEKAAGQGRLAGIVERRFTASVAGWTLSGKVDHFDPATGILTDYKTCGAYATTASKPEWEAQLNVLAYLLTRNGHTVNKVQISAFVRDWMQSKLAKEKNYPKTQLPTLPMNLWTFNQQQKYVMDRLAKLDEGFYGTGPEPCSRAETWDGRRCKNWCNVAKFCEQYSARDVDPRTRKS